VPPVNLHSIPQNAHPSGGLAPPLQLMNNSPTPRYPTVECRAVPALFDLLGIFAMKKFRVERVATA
jgi:hypothetical protein